MLKDHLCKSYELLDIYEYLRYDTTGTIYTNICTQYNYNQSYYAEFLCNPKNFRLGFIKFSFTGHVCNLFYKVYFAVRTVIVYDVNEKVLLKSFYYIKNE